MLSRMQQRFRNGRVLVTGGAGFIGSALIWYLNSLGITDIVVTDVLGRDEKWRNLVPLKYEDYYEADDFLNLLQQDDNLLASMKIRCVFHFGASASYSEKDASYLAVNNFGYAKILARSALNANARFVYASSVASYPDGLCSDNDADLSNLRPATVYSYTKHMFDLWAQRHNILNDMVGIKYFNVFGPNEYHKEDMRSLVLKSADKIIKTGRADIFKSHIPNIPDGGQTGDFLYIKDAVKTTFDLAMNPNACGLFNIGSGIQTSCLDVVKAVFEALGKPVATDVVEMPPADEYSSCLNKTANLDKLRQAGCYHEPMPLADAVKDYVGNYLPSRITLGW